jgi:hypothetical protein
MSAIQCLRIAAQVRGRKGAGKLLSKYAVRTDFFVKHASSLISCTGERVDANGAGGFLSAEVRRASACLGVDFPVLARFSPETNAVGKELVADKQSAAATAAAGPEMKGLGSSSSYSFKRSARFDFDSCRLSLSQLFLQLDASSVVCLAGRQSRVSRAAYAQALRRSIRLQRNPEGQRPAEAGERRRAQADQSLWFISADGVEEQRRKTR